MAHFLKLAEKKRAASVRFNCERIKYWKKDSDNRVFSLTVFSCFMYRNLADSASTAVQSGLFSDNTH